MKIIRNSDEMQTYLSDESRRAGTAQMICFPETAGDIAGILREYPQEQITVQGARTGLTAGCVPEQGGIILSTERMDRILKDPNPCADGTGQYEITVQPGMKLCRLREILSSHGLFFPPDPTEPTASIGGMVSCNSSGARSYRYGQVRPYVAALEIVLADGGLLHLRRGMQRCRGRSFQAVTAEGARIEGELPQVHAPMVRKSAAGYYLHPDMDLADLFIGAEGTLGILASVTLRVLPQRKRVWGAIQFFEEERQAIRFAGSVRQEGPSLEALEYFGIDCLRLIRTGQKEGWISSACGSLQENMRCGVYVEAAGEDPAELSGRFRSIARACRNAGGDPYLSWAAVSSTDLQRLKEFRHCAPVAVNESISRIRREHPQITKLGTDMSVPFERLPELFERYRRDLTQEGFRSAVFGHIGDGHLHVNIIPGNMEEYERGRDQYLRWAREVVRMGGAVSAEHGIGKLKRWLLQEQYAASELEAMRRLKFVFDPKGVLDPGNLFPV